jgi:hypothetical protein
LFPWAFWLAAALLLALLLAPLALPLVMLPLTAWVLPLRWLAEPDGTVVGTLALVLECVTPLAVGSVCPDARGLGFGLALAWPAATPLP